MGKTMVRRFAGLIGTVMTLVVVVGVVALAGLLVGVPAASGGAALTVWTGSMEPEIPRGSMVVVRPVNPFRLEPGDVITYQVRPDDPTFVTHRVVEVQSDAEPPSVITKGDANQSVDADPIEMQWIRGQVLVHVPYLGSVGERVRTPTGMTVLLLLFGGAATVMLGRTVVGELRKGRQEGESQDEDRTADSGFAPPTSADAPSPSDSDTASADERRAPAKTPDRG